VSDFHFCTTPRRANLWKYIKVRIREANADSARIDSAVTPTIWLPESHCPELAEFLAKKIFQIRNEVDLLLISGDIGTTGLPEDLRLGVNYVNNPPAHHYFGADGTATIRSTAFPILLMPGNHDRFQNYKAEPNCRTFDLLFQDHWARSDPQISTAILNRPDTEPLAVLAADFALRAEGDAAFPTRWMRYGQGYAYEDVLEKMVKKTSELRTRFSGIGIVWAIHFPPTNECRGFCGYQELRYHSRVVEAAGSSGVKLILAGHIHEKKEIRLGDLDIICAGSGCGFGEKHGNWLHDLEVEVVNGVARISKKIDYKWEEENGNFVSQESAQ
jgi:3',5'-cyclic AMP phosphodiesterase CpdA